MEASGPAPVHGQSSGGQGGRLCARCGAERLRSVLRDRSRARKLLVPRDPPVWSAEAATIAREDRREALEAVASLPRRAREVLVLRYYLGLADHEIAAALGVSRGTVSSTASRALAALARQLQEQR